MKAKKLTSQLLNEHTLFHEHPEAWVKISPYVQVNHLSKGEHVIYHGDAANLFWMVIQGWIKLSRQTPDGKESIIGLCTRGDVFGEAALFAQANYPYNAESLSANVELAAIPANVLRRLTTEDPAFSATIMSLLNNRVAQMQLKLEHMSTLSAQQRLGCFLLHLCEFQQEGQKTLQIPVEKHVLASYLGMKSETLSRCQQQLSAIGISVQGSQVNIGNINRLRQFVCNSCSESGSCDSEIAD